MSKDNTTTKKKRKTRLKGTETMKPCFDCKVLKNRFTDFKSRWAGCVAHRTENGRRFFQLGCADCSALVNGNIRQPRCIQCDAARPKKGKSKKKKTATVKPTQVVEPTTEPVAVEPKAEPSVESVKVPEPPPAPPPAPLPRVKVAASQPALASDILRMLDEAEASSE